MAEQKSNPVWQHFTKPTPGKARCNICSRLVSLGAEVILDTLSVTSHSQALSRVEGDSLQLNCEVSRQTLQHSHLSVGWYLRAEPSTPPLDLLTLSRDFVLRAGTPYKQRFASGDLRLDKMGSTAYRLTIHRLQPADQGLLYCEASEWIQDPDRSWYSMTRKQSEKTPLKVQPADRDFNIQLSTERRAYMTGEPLELRCAIDAQNILERYFSVSWVFSSSPVAMVGPNAVPLLAGDYVQRETTGQLTVRKESQAVYLLRLQNLRPEDAGKYICRVTERERTLTGDFIDRSKRSRNVQVTVQPLRSNLTVSLISNSTDIEESGTIQLMCEIQSISGKVAGLSVTWRRLDRNGSTEQHIAALDQEGVVKLSPAYSDRAAYGGIRAERTDIDTFSLSIYTALPSDEGQYECEVTEWLPGPNNTWDSIGEKTAATYVMVQGKEPSFFVFASSRTPSVTYGDSFDLQCIVKPQHDPQMPTAVTWRFQPQLDGLPDAAFRDLMTFSHDGMIRWGDVAPGPGTRITVEHATSSSNFRLSVNRAGPREAGTYLCSAQLWRKNYNHSWSMVTERNSNLLGINVLKPVSKLTLQQTNQSVVLVEDGRIQINCSIVAQTSLEAQHAVLWYTRRSGTGGAGEAQAELLLKVDQESALKYGAFAEEERLQSRVQAERLSSQVHRLTLHRAELADSGYYFCVVEEWLSDPSGDWYLLGREASGFTKVLVTQPEVHLQVMEADTNVTVEEAGSIRLGCSIPSQSSRDSRFSVSWYVSRVVHEGVAEDCVFSIGHDAVFGNGNCSPAEVLGPDSRLRFERPSYDLYSLSVQRVQPSDRGNYSCLVEEWLQNPRGVWYRLTTSRSGITVVTVLPPASTLMSVVCSSNSLFYFVFFYPFPVFGLLFITILLVRYKSHGTAKNQEAKNGAPLLWIKEPHINYSPTCLDPPALGLQSGCVE
ncbi:immunoglobulin superfamily member 3 isoform X2 [Paramormyrops kingsleyae]|uniref:immunoglobulin superfamily member 3 isoform X2 n=1 Tax=Paramormyrops kingsleyae TaxID=1676925 RepID=UPI003B9798BA